MKRAPIFGIAVWLMLSASLSLVAADKSAYDLASPPSHGAHAKADGLGGASRLLTHTISEASLVEGGYYTLGTHEGLSQSTLDNACTITYGHPFAKTSYPLLYLDGAWIKPADFFTESESSITGSGDSLMLVCTRPGVIELRFVIRMGNNGETIHLISSLKNLDNVAHTLGTGLVFDPSVGKGGDCALSLDGKPVQCDTVLSYEMLGSRTVAMAERSSWHSGVRAMIYFPSLLPQTLTIGNWNTAHDNDTPSPQLSDERTLYDALIKMFWAPVLLQPQASIDERAEIIIAAPDFGSGIFTRWDLPQTQAVENNIPFPEAFTSTLTLANQSSEAKNSLSVELAHPEAVTTPSTPLSVSAGALQSAYLAIPLTIDEVYENTVVSLRAITKDNGTPVDTLTVPFRICRTPQSDTGLTVTVDSVWSPASSKTSIIFDVQKNFPKQYLFDLAPKNLFLYENASRITDFTLGKDTTGGSGSVDIVFVLDVTGSMSGEIAGVKNNIMEFADSLARHGLDYRLGMVTFLDVIESVYDFTSNPAVFKQYVSAQNAHAGGDLPENSLDALYRASELQFRPEARKVFIWITDASYHERNNITSRVRQDVIARLLSLDITVHSIGAQEFETDWYNPIIQPTGGKYYNINGNFRDILLDIGNLHSSFRYLVSYTSSGSQGASRMLSLVVHYAGLGDSVSVPYSAPRLGAGVAMPRVACYPNPFNPQTTIEMMIPADARAELVIYNLLGQEVNRFALKGAGGLSRIVWNARDAKNRGVGAGLYFVRTTFYAADNRTLGTDIAKVLYIK